jgi:hypothetical protein
MGFLANCTHAVLQYNICTSNGSHSNRAMVILDRAILKSRVAKRPCAYHGLRGGGMGGLQPLGLGRAGCCERLGRGGHRHVAVAFA